MNFLDYIRPSTRWAVQLRSQIIEKTYLETFDECIRCWKHDSLRAGYILTWTLLAESLKNKIGTAADQGEKQAIDISNKIQAEEKDERPVDKVVIEGAKALSLVETSAIKDLEFLWAKRCVFAHPYELSPSRSELQHIIERTVTLSLGQTLRHRKPYLEDLVERLATIPHFLPSAAQTVRAYAQSTIRRTPHDLWPFLFKTLVYRAGVLAGGADAATKEPYILRIRYFLLELVETAGAQIHDPAWRLEFFATDHPLSCFVGFVDPTIWSFLPTRTAEILVEFALTSVATLPGNISPLKLMYSIAAQGGLHRPHTRRLVTSLRAADMSNLIPLGFPFHLLYPKVLKTLQGLQFNEIIPVVAYLRTLSASVVAKLRPRRQWELGHAITAAAAGNSWAAQNLLNQISTGAIKASDHCLIGIFSGAFLINHAHYLVRRDYIGPTVRALLTAAIPPDTLRPMLNEVLTRLRDSPGAWFKLGSINHLLRELVKERGLNPADKASIMLLRRHLFSRRFA